MTSVLPLLAPNIAPWATNVTDGYQQSKSHYIERPSTHNQPHQASRSSNTLTTVEHASSRRQSTPRSSLSAPRPQTRKRIQSEDDDNNDEEPQNKKSVTEDTAHSTPHLLACPYHKFDSIRYGQEEQYRSCSKGWSQIPGMIHHLNRAHRPRASDRRQPTQEPEKFQVCSHTGLPPYFTPNRSHRAKDCQDGRMTEQHQAQIRLVSRKKKSSVRLWYEIYTTLFPTRIPPRSPYIQYDHFMPSKVPPSNTISTGGTSSLSHESQTEGVNNSSPTAPMQKEDKPLSRSPEVFWPVVSQVVRKASVQFLSAWAINQMLATAEIAKGQGRTDPPQVSNRTESATGNRVSKSRSQKSNQNKKKPQRTNRDDKNDGGDSGDELPEQPGLNADTDPPSNQLGSLLKCPYYVHDPFRYSETNTVELEYRSCQTAVLRDIARMKQHLERDHKRPDYFCPRCFVVKKSQAELGEHLRRTPICAVTIARDFSERMTDDQFHEIKRKRVGGTIKEKYDECYEILFPGEEPPASPFCDGTSYEFRAFLGRQLPIILERTWRGTGYVPSPSVARDIASIVTQNILHMIQTPLNIAQLNIEALSAGLSADLSGQSYGEVPTTPSMVNPLANQVVGQTGGVQRSDNRNEVQPSTFDLRLDLDQPNEFDQLFEEWYNDMTRNRTFSNQDFSQLGRGINSQIEEPLLSYQTMISPQLHEREAIQRNLRSRREEVDTNGRGIPVRNNEFETLRMA